VLPRRSAVILRLEDNVSLLGAIAGRLAVPGAMVLTRQIDRFTDCLQVISAICNLANQNRKYLELHREFGRILLGGDDRHNIDYS